MFEGKSQKQPLFYRHFGFPNPNFVNIPAVGSDAASSEYVQSSGCELFL